MNYTYILELNDGTLYTGWTNDLENRVAAHNAGTASKCTRAKRPVKLVHYEEFETKSEAMSREYRIKQMSREEKLNLIKKQANGPEILPGSAPQPEEKNDAPV